MLPRLPSRSSSRIRSATSAVLLTVGLGIAAPAAAQDSATEAAAAFDQGTQYFGRGQFALALESFRTAYRLRAHPAILLNLATCYDRLGRAQEAVTEYHRYRRLRGSGIEPERRRFVEDALRRLGPQVSLLWITRPSQDAAVAIDGTEVEIGEDPLVVAPGPHTIESRSGDGRYTQTEVQAVGGQVHNVVLRFAGQMGGGRGPIGPGPEGGPGPQGPPPGEGGLEGEGPGDGGGGEGGGHSARESDGWDPSLRWIGVGATLVFGGCMIFTASRALSLSDEYEATEDESVKQDGLTYRAVTEFVFFPATLLAAGFTVLAFVFAADGEESPSARSAFLMPTPDGFVAGARGTF